MRIRTQNREQLVDITGRSICIDTYKDGYEIHTGVPRNTLGCYSSKEKALLVLDMIEKEYDKFVYKNGTYRKYGCFDMPKDDEVYSKAYEYSMI